MAIAGLLPLPALAGGAYRERVAQLALRLILAGNRQRFYRRTSRHCRIEGCAA